MINKLRATTLLILMALITYLLLTESGIASNFNAKYQAKAIEMESKSDVPIRVTEHVYTVSLLNNKKPTDIVIYEGALKKKVLDEMDHVGWSELVFDGKPSEKSLKLILKRLAEDVDANVVIIDNYETRARIITNGGKE